MKLINKYESAKETEKVINGLAGTEFELDEYINDDYRHYIICQAIEQGLDENAYIDEEFDYIFHFAGDGYPEAFAIRPDLEIISFAFYIDNEGNKAPFCFTNKSRLICDKIRKEQDKYIFTIKDDLVELDFTIKIDDDEKGKLICDNKLFSLTNIMDIELNKSPNPLSQNFFDI